MSTRFYPIQAKEDMFPLLVSRMAIFLFFSCRVFSFLCLSNPRSYISVLSVLLGRQTLNNKHMEKRAARSLTSPNLSKEDAMDSTRTESLQMALRLAQENSDPGKKKVFFLIFQPNFSLLAAKDEGNQDERQSASSRTSQSLSPNTIAAALGSGSSLPITQFAQVSIWTSNVFVQIIK